MALQSQRRTKSSKKRRASHFALKKQNLVACPKCGKLQKPHYACASCGNYKGVGVLKLKTRTKLKKKDNA